MTQTPVETCCRCGRTIDIKQYRSYHVTEDYRLICEPCFRTERPTVSDGERGGESEKKRSTEKKS
jgi:recombinational DNA repair protein (RecF pathway)